MSANLWVPGRYDENVRRLALGVEPVDAMRAMRVAHPVSVTVEGVQPGYAEVARHASCRHALLLRPGIHDRLTLRLSDRAERFVPRRLTVLLPPAVTRSCRPALFPAAAYDVGGCTTGLRGRITRGGAPMRWARVEARLAPAGAVVGRAHGDAHGEFLLLLRPVGSAGDPGTTLEVRVDVYGPDAAPDPAAHPEWAVDPLWDLPVETVPLPGDPDDVSDGTALPAGYVVKAGSSRAVTLELGRFSSESFDFS